MAPENGRVGALRGSWQSIQSILSREWTVPFGSVNFLFDKSQKPHFRAGELCDLFGVSQRSGSLKASEIRKMFRMGPMDVEWCLPSKLDENPLA